MITSSFSCTIFSDVVYRLLSEWCVVTSFYQSSANHVYFYAFFFLRNLLYLIDMAVGFIVIPNMIAVLLLSPKFFEIFHGYLADLKRKERS